MGPDREAAGWERLNRRPVVAALALGLLALLPQAAGAAGHVNVIVLAGSVNPASSDFIQRAIRQSVDERAEALLIELDTPGGLVSSTKDIIQAMLGAEVPLLVYVSPRGAWAGSAGVFVTMAANVAAMAPGTTIGAAHPVSMGPSAPPQEGEEGEDASRDFAAEKMENMLAAFSESIARERDRNVEWAERAVRESVAVTADEALELKVIDLVVGSRQELFDRADGLTVKVAGVERTLQLAGAEVRVIEMTLSQRILHALSNPDVAFLLLLAGLLGVYIEYNSPGLIVPGALGVVCLMLTGIAFQILPFSSVGLLLFLAGIALMVAEAFVTSYGVLFVTGLVCLLVGGATLFDLPEANDLRISFWSVLVPAVAAFSICGAIVVFAVGRSMRRVQTAGISDLIGLRGRADEALAPEGRVYVRGEYWSATGEDVVAVGEPVEVVGVEGMHLRVRKVPRPK